MEMVVAVRVMVVVVARVVMLTAVIAVVMMKRRVIMVIVFVSGNRIEMVSGQASDLIIGGDG